MHPAPTPCAGCGEPLPAANAVCSRCEAALAAPPVPVAKHRCPTCQAPVIQFELVYYPPDAPWYRPTTRTLCCPHCRTWVRPHHDLPEVRHNMTGFLLITLFLNTLEPKAPFMQGLALTSMAVVMVYGLTHLLRSGREPLSFVPDERMPAPPA